MNTFHKYKIEIYAPCECVEKLRDALNEAGASHVGMYDNCISYFTVSGYWRPLSGSNPHAGEIGAINKGKECKIETVCDSEKLSVAIKAIKRVHPYEEPLINIIPLIEASSDVGRH
jgi:hypothetical protein